MMDVYKDLFIKGIHYIFLFNKVLSPQGNKYFISVRKGTQTQVDFEMVQGEDGNWKVLPPAPSWIFEIEIMLSTILDDSAKHH